MNRAAFAARAFLIVVLLPIIGAAGWATYEYRTQPPAPPKGASREFGNTALLTSKQLPNGFILGTYTASLRQFDKAIDAKASLSLTYIAYGRLFPADYVNYAAKNGAKTVIELLPKSKKYSMAMIAAGKSDVWIKSFAKTIVTVRQPVILSFGPEMNGSWYQYGSGKSSPGSWVSAYKHFHDVLIGAVRHDLKELQIPERAGKLVSFMWQPSAMHKKTHTPAPYWPGKQYVDLVGLDGYYYYSDDTFASIFGKTLKLVRSLTSAPVMIGETAAAPEFNKETWDIDDLFAGVRANHLLGLIWFDENQLYKKYAAGQRKFHQDWHIQDFPSAVATFRKDLAGQGKIASYEMHG